MFSENWTKRFFAQPEGYSDTDQILRVIGRHTLVEAFSQVMRVALNCKGQKHLKKTAVHLNSTLARPRIYGRAYSEKLSAFSPGNPVVVTKPVLLLLLVEQDKKSVWKSKSLMETNLSAINPYEKFARIETCIKAHCCTLCLIYS